MKALFSRILLAVVTALFLCAPGPGFGTSGTAQAENAFARFIRGGQPRAEHSRYR